MDQLFNFGFINFVLSTFPPALAADVEKFSEERSFGHVLLGMAANPTALRHIHSAFALALAQAKSNPQSLQKAALEIQSKIQMGVRTPGGRL